MWTRRNIPAKNSREKSEIKILYETILLTQRENFKKQIVIFRAVRLLRQTPRNDLIRRAPMNSPM